MFKKKKQIIFTIVDGSETKEGFLIQVNFKGDVIDAHLLGVKQFIDEQVNKVIQKRNYENKKVNKNG